LDFRLVMGSFHLAALGVRISPADSRFAHARQAAQHISTLGLPLRHLFLLA